MNAVYKAKRLGSNFNIKDKISFEHQHNVVYHAKCPNKRCTSHYTGETRCRIGKRGDQHKGKDKKSHIFRHGQKTKHKKVDLKDFKILGKGYRSNFTRKISEALFIKKLKPDLNVQKESYKLILFNWRNPLHQMTSNKYVSNILVSNVFNVSPVVIKFIVVIMAPGVRVESSTV